MNHQKSISTGLNVVMTRLPHEGSPRAKEAGVRSKLWTCWLPVHLGSVGENIVARPRSHPTVWQADHKDGP